MNDTVKWIKIKVGMFDGHSFKRIKKARIDGVVDFRDKLTAVWFELLDLGGKINNSGFLINDEIAFKNYEDIAIALDRTEKEVIMCIEWFLKNNMMEIVDDIFLISNWSKYQNEDGLEKLRMQNAERQRKFRETQKKKLLDIKEENSNVTVTLPITPSNAIEEEIEKEIEKEEEKEERLKPSLSTIVDSPISQPINYQSIFEYWNNNSKLREITTMTEKRKGNVNARFKEHGLDAIFKVIDNCSNSLFMRGDNSRNWQADFDWVFKPTNFVKVLEGNYLDKTPQTFDNEIERRIKEAEQRAHEFNNIGGEIINDPFGDY